MDFIRVFVNSPLSKVYQLGKASLLRKYTISLSMHSDRLHNGIVHGTWRRKQSIKGLFKGTSPLILCASAKRFHRSCKRSQITRTRTPKTTPIDLIAKLQTSLLDLTYRAAHTRKDKRNSSEIVTKTKS